MADQQDGPLEVEQQLFQQFQGLGIQVVGGLIEHQQVGRAGEQLGQQQPVALAPGQGADRLAGALRAEKEVLEIGQDMTRATAHIDLVAAPGHVVLDRLGQIELGAQLIEIGDLEVGPAPDGPGLGLQFPQQELEQCALARPVGPDDADLVPAQNERIQAPNYGLVPPRVVHPLGLHHQAPAALGLV